MENEGLGEKKKKAFNVIDVIMAVRNIRFRSKRLTKRQVPR